MTRNEATWDRLARVAVAVVLAAVGFGVVGGTAGTIIGVVAIVPLATGLAGWCPLYQLFGISTCPVSGTRHDQPSKGVAA